MKKLLLTTAAVVAVTFSGVAHAADLEPSRDEGTAAAVRADHQLDWLLRRRRLSAMACGIRRRRSSKRHRRGQHDRSDQRRAGLAGYGAGRLRLPGLANIVIGAFADYDWSSIKGNAGHGAIVGSEKLSSSWAAGGRIGWVVVPQFLVFVSPATPQARFDRINFCHCRKRRCDGPVHRSAYLRRLVHRTGYEYGDRLPARPVLEDGVSVL